MSFSLRSCLVALAIAAVGFTAMFGQVQWAVALTYTITLVALAIAAVGALVTHGQRRVYWLGFAVLGGAYWLWGFDEASPMPAGVQPAPFGYTYSPAGYARFEHRLITSNILEAIETGITRSREVGAQVMAQWGGGYYPAKIAQANHPQYLVAWSDGSQPTWVTSAQLIANMGATRSAGHSLFCLIFGVIGGALAVWMFGGDRWREGEKQSPLVVCTESTGEAHPLDLRKE